MYVTNLTFTPILMSFAISLALSLCASPDVNRYAKVRRHIFTKYAETEQLLVNEFIESLRSLDSRRMKEYAVALQPFGKVNSLSHTHTLSLVCSSS